MTNDVESPLWCESPKYFLIIALALAALVWSFSDGLGQMVKQWGSSEEYGYGYIIPALTVFFIWQLKNELAKIEFTGSWVGVVILALSGVLLVVGNLSALFIIVQYAFLVAIFGFALSIMGWRAFKMIMPALFLLVFMIPLPNFLYQGLSSELQLISSRLGVEVIRLFGISVFLAGNVIDLGPFQLQVVDACSGLRYLFPLAALSYMSAYIFKGSPWKKVIIVVSSAPITVLMNSFRIGVIGVLVEYGGISQAQGFLHEFEGWFVFMACMLILFLEMYALSKIGNPRVAFSDVFGFVIPEKIKSGRIAREYSKQFISTIPVLLLISAIPFFLSQRDEIIPTREAFSGFPMQIDGWNGVRSAMDQRYIDVLKFDDYIMASYTRHAADVDLYIAYYKSQRKGASIHSPSSCIPGGGWQIQSREIKQISISDDTKLFVNRLLIQKGSNRQLVYYWFDERGRDLTNEYVVKWYLFWDALTKNRSDGSLIRVITTVNTADDIENSDKSLQDFISDSYHVIQKYLPR